MSEKTYIPSWFRCLWTFFALVAGFAAGIASAALTGVSGWFHWVFILVELGLAHAGLGVATLLFQPLPNAAPRV